MMGTAIRDGYLDAAGVSLHYVEQGEGEPVVLLHGYTSDIRGQWMDTGVFPALARAYRTIALDARGHGSSDKPHDPSAYGTELGDDVPRLLDHLAIDRAHIVGYSMGAHTVAKLLTRHPERFRTAVLGGACGRRNWTERDQRRVDTEAAEMEQGLPRSAILRLWPDDRPRPTEEELHALAVRQLEGHDRLALAALRRSTPAQVITEAAMRAVTVPTLGIVGTSDPYLADFRRLEQIMPQLGLVTIKGADHVSAPGRAEFRDALIAFLIHQADTASSRTEPPHEPPIPTDQAGRRGNSPG